MSLKIEEVKTPLSEQFRLSTRRFYPKGSIRLTPSDCVLSKRYQEFAEKIKKLEVREDDVWIVTYPKCGTTWTQEMVWLLMNNLDFEAAKSLLFERSPFVEFYGIAYPEEEAEDNIPFGDTISLTESVPSPRCIKSHLPKDLLPDQLWTKKPKIIYVTRGFKDVISSYYNHHRVCNGYTGTLEQFAEAMMAENIVYWDPFWKHILDFWKMKDEPNILINSFEDMKKDLPGIIRKTAAFLGKEITEEEVSQLAKHLDFSNMKNNAAVNFGEYLQPLREKYAVDTQFMRKGEVGSGKKELSPEMIAKIDKFSQERIKNSGYPFVGSEWKDAIKMTCNFAAVRSVLGRSRDDGYCRRGHSEIDTLSHVLGSCPFGEALRNVRHHTVRKLLADSLRKTEYITHEEVSGIAVGGSTRRIDVIAY